MIGWNLNDFYSPNKMHYNIYEEWFKALSCVKHCLNIGPNALYKTMILKITRSTRLPPPPSPPL